MPDAYTEMTIDELARQAEIVVSTARLYQTRGLLPPPVKRGRVGFYNESHLDRLRLIAQLQDRGFSLAGIKELLEGIEKGESLRTVLGLSDKPSTWTPEQSLPMSFDELLNFLPQVEFTPDMARRIIDLGLVEFSPDGTTVDVLSPSFLAVGRELAALGVPPEVILDEYEHLHSEAQIIADRFTEVFRGHLWEPFVEKGMPAESMNVLVGALEKLGPLAEAVVITSLRHALQASAETFIEKETKRLGVDIRRPA